MTLLEESTGTSVGFPAASSCTSSIVPLSLPVPAVYFIPTAVPKFRYSAWLIFFIVSASFAPAVNVIVRFTPSSVAENEYVSPLVNWLISAPLPTGVPVTVPAVFTVHAVARRSIESIFILLTAFPETDVTLIFEELLTPVIVLYKLLLSRFVSPLP